MIVSEKDKKRFLDKVKYTKRCWVWIAGLSSGYGSFRYKGRAWLAHKFMYEMLIGRVKVGLQLDHLCRNRKCVFPGHLEEVTQKENILRGSGTTAVNKRKKKCLRGHKLAGSNLYESQLRKGQRACIKCNSIRYYSRK